LDYKFDVCSSGVLGVGSDITKWTEKEKIIAEKKIANYKIIRTIVQRGVLHRLISPFIENRCALQYVGNNDSCAVFCYNMAEYLAGSQIDSRGSKTLRLKGLDAHQLYSVVIMDDQNEAAKMYNGDFLMNIGLGWPVKGANQSAILFIKKATKPLKK
jgi:alpha-galactosidase